MHKCIVLLASLLVLLAGVQSGFGRIGPVPDANEEYIYAQDSMAGVYNNPPLPTVFTIDEPRTITKLGSYHYNNGNGQIPGTLGLQDQNGKIYGPWQASSPQGQSGVPVYWVVTIPNGGVDLPAGKYTVVDSDPSTWSYNSETDNCGVVAVVALKSTKGAVQLSGNWKMAGHQTGFNDWEADLILNTDGTLGWTETQGANVGATRTGTWLFDGTTFTMTWIAPEGGKTNWISRSVTVNYIGDGTYIVENAPGGTWTATRTATRATTTPKAPCGEGATDLSIASPTDQYRAGVSLAPGSYNIWYGKRTGTEIGQPDNWNTKTVELLGGKFYVFDVSTGSLGEATPQMLNPMLSNPTSSESVVWYKASTQYPYVVCFEGPLNQASPSVTQSQPMPVENQGCSWSGTWSTNWGEQVMHQSGDEISGTYTHDQGKIVGTVSGNKLKGTWSEAPTYSPPHDAGDVELTLSDDCKSFSGNWRYGSEGGWSGDWTGTRTTAASPVSSGSTDNVTSVPNPNFAGTYGHL